MYTIYGNEQANEVIVAIPALGERKEMYVSLANEMKEYKWIVFDLPGSNKEILEDYSIPAFCAYIKETLDELTIEKAHFIGNSLGAWIIQAFTASYPQYVRSLGLLDGGHYFLGERNENHEDVILPRAIEKIEDIQEAVKELTYAMPQLSKQAYAQFESYMLANYIELPDGYAHHCDNDAYNALSKEIETTNYCLTDVKKPLLLIIAGASADEMSYSKAMSFNERFNQAEVFILENGQHYLPLTNTIQVAEILIGFYRSL